MSASILSFALGYAQIALALAACLAGWRTLRGPRAQDRVLGLDTLYVQAMLLFMVVYAPFQAVFWFAPLFAGMHRVPAIRSIFFSAVSVWRNKLPLFGYFTGWLVFAVVWGLVVRTVAMLLLPSIGPTLLPVAMVLLMVLVYSSYWPTYRDIVDPPPDTLPTPAN